MIMQDNVLCLETAYTLLESEDYMMWAHHYECQIDNSFAMCKKDVISIITACDV